MTAAVTSLAVLQQEVLGNRILAVHQSKKPTVLHNPESAYPEQEWMYWNWYIELESGVLLQLDEFTLAIIGSRPEPTAPAELCTTRMHSGFRDFRGLIGSETHEFLSGRQITQIITRYHEDVELKPIFLVLDQSCQLYVANKEFGNTFQMDELDLQIDVLSDDYKYNTIPAATKCDALGKIIPFLGQ